MGASGGIGTHDARAIRPAARGGLSRHAPYQQARGVREERPAGLRHRGRTRGRGNKEGRQAAPRGTGEVDEGAEERRARALRFRTRSGSRSTGSASPDDTSTTGTGRHEESLTEALESFEAAERPRCVAPAATGPNARRSQVPRAGIEARRATRNTVPLPTWVSNVSSPWNECTMPWEIESPSPVPSP